MIIRKKKQIWGHWKKNDFERVERGETIKVGNINKVKKERKENLHHKCKREGRRWNGVRKGNSIVWGLNKNLKNIVKKIGTKLENKIHCNTNNK